MASTTPIENTFRSSAIEINIPIASAEVIQRGAFVGLDIASGRAVDMSQSDDVFPLGFAENFVDNSATAVTTQGQDTQGTGDAAGDVLVTVSLQDRIIEELTITGASAETVRGDFVYMTDENTYTLTRPTSGLPVGWVIRWISASDAAVLMFSASTQAAIGIAGGGRFVEYLGEVDSALATGNAITGIIHRHPNSELVDVYAIVTEAATGTSANVILINLELNAVNVTGGVITLTVADAVGTVLAGSAITSNAGSRVHDGELIDVETVNTGTFTAGIVGVYAVWEARLGG